MSSYRECDSRDFCDEQSATIRSLEQKLEAVRVALGFGVLEKQIIDGEEMNITPDAYYGIGGAIIDIERGRAVLTDNSLGWLCDRVCMDTLKRVEEQLGNAAKIFSET